MEPVLGRTADAEMPVQRLRLGEEAPCRRPQQFEAAASDIEAAGALTVRCRFDASSHIWSSAYNAQRKCVADLYMYADGRKATKAIQGFVDFLLEPEGQRLVEQSGYLPA
ncbi:MAG TPA: hypothetical protein VHR45_01130 [Thermoanaerobaculia bacterium]|nr:hypothetical protein [Thermoanaerobaculia bacterium]